MKFCSKCGGIVVPKKDDGKIVWVCNSCGALQEEGDIKKITQKIKSEDKGIVLVEENKESLPITEKECPKCGHKHAYWWTQQTRASDEPETRFYRCVKCKYTWREYS